MTTTTATRRPWRTAAETAADPKPKPRPQRPVPERYDEPVYMMARVGYRILGPFASTKELLAARAKAEEELRHNDPATYALWQRLART